MNKRTKSNEKQPPQQRHSDLLFPPGRRQQRRLGLLFAGILDRRRLLAPQFVEDAAQGLDGGLEALADAVPGSALCRSG